MENMPKTTNLSLKIDSNLKKEAENLFQKLGLSMNTAINVFLTQSIKEQAIPFEIHENKPSKKLLNALKEAEKIKKHPGKYKGYKSVDELFNNLLK